MCGEEGLQRLHWSECTFDLDSRCRLDAHRQGLGSGAGFAIPARLKRTDTGICLKLRYFFGSTGEADAAGQSPRSSRPPGRGLCILPCSDTVDDMNPALP